MHNKIVPNVKLKKTKQLWKTMKHFSGQADRHIYKHVHKAAEHPHPHYHTTIQTVQCFCSCFCFVWIVFFFFLGKVFPSNDTLTYTERERECRAHRMGQNLSKLVIHLKIRLQNVIRKSKALLLNSNCCPI